MEESTHVEMALTLIEKFQAIERFLDHRSWGDTPLRRSIQLTGSRQEARGMLERVAGDFFAHGEPTVRARREGLSIPERSNEVIAWDDVIDEAIDVDAGADTWELPQEVHHRGTEGTEKQSVLSTTTPAGIQALDSDAMLGPNGPIAGPARQVNGKPRKGKKQITTEITENAEQQKTSVSSEPSVAKTMGADAVDTLTIPLSSIEPNPYQPRLDFNQEELQELADGLNRDGLLHSIVVRKAPVTSNPQRYQLIDGERRWRAAKLAGWLIIRSAVREASDEEMARLAIVANDQRADLNPIERARGYQRLLKLTKQTQEALGKSLGKSQAYVANHLRLLELPAAWQARVISREMSASHAQELLVVVKYPAVLARLEKDVAGEIEREGSFPSLAEFKTSVFDAVHRTCERLDERRYVDSLGTYLDQPAWSEEDRQAMGALTIADRWREGEATFATNKKVFQARWQRHVAAIKKERGIKPQTKGKGGGSREFNYKAQEARSREKRRQEERKQFRGTWLFMLVAGELAKRDDDDPIWERMLLAALADSDFDVFWGTKFENRFKPPKAKPNWHYESGAVAAAIFARPAKDFRREHLLPIVRGAITFDKKKGPSIKHMDGVQIESLAAELTIVPLEHWRRELCGPLTEAFFNLHSADELVELGKSIGLHLVASKPRKILVQQLTASAALKQKLPALLAPPAAEKKGGKKKR